MLRTVLLFACMSLAAPVLAQSAEDDDMPPAPPPEDALAEPAPEPTGASEEQAMRMPASEAEPAAPADDGARTHDGFHLRFALGFGGVSDTLTATIPVGGFDVEIDGKASGGSFAGHLAIGGEIASGLFLGGAMMSETVTTPEVEFEGIAINGVDVGTLGMLGVMIDWYPDERGGFHFGGVLAGATINTEDSEGNMPDAEDRPAGGAVVLTVGYDFWVASEWSLGVLGRFTGATLTGDVNHQLAAASILFSVLYN